VAASRAAAYFAESLRHSSYAEEVRLGDLAAIAQEAYGRPAQRPAMIVGGAVTVSPLTRR
jgi:hypothetical protein